MNPHSPFWVIVQSFLGQSDCRCFETLLSQEINMLSFGPNQSDSKIFETWVTQVNLEMLSKMLAPFYTSRRDGDQYSFSIRRGYTQACLKCF